MGVDDYWNVRQIADIQTSARGRTALVVRSVSRERNERDSHVWLVASGAGESQPLIDSTAFDSQPRWSPDGARLVITTADRAGGVARIAFIDVANGRRQTVANGGDATHSAAWSPAGDALCYVADVPVDELAVEAEHQWYAAHPAARRGAPLVRATSLRARSDGSGYRRSAAQLRLLSLERNAAPVVLTAAEADDVDPAWSPDGRRIAFVSSRSADRRCSAERNVWSIDVASGELRQLTSGFWLWGPLAWSPDGRHVACFGMEALRVPLAIRMWLVAADGSGAVAASDGFGAHLWPHGAPAWTADGERIVGAGVLGNAGSLVAFDRRSHARSVLLEAEAVFGLVQLQPDGQRFLAAASTPRSPAALVLGTLSGGALELVHDFNSWLADAAPAPAQPVRFTAADGLEISGWLVSPAAAPQPPPCVLDVHYGPNAAWGPAFAPAAQAFAARGIATLLLNPRGSAGYGDAFAAAADFGERDFDDLMAGIDALVAQGRIDGDRLGIMGLSYGGFMAAWAIGHSDRFRAAVSINGISNQLTWHLLSDTGMFFYAERFGDPFASGAHLERYWRHSPLAASANIDTPLLLIASENDYRCPIDQGEQLFGALVARGKTVELIRVPNASHDLNGTASPLHAYLTQRLTLEWFERFIVPPPS